MPFPNDETKFKPGQSGNPEGKAKGTKNRATLLKKYGQLIAKGHKFSNLDIDADGLTAEEIGAIQVVAAMANGDLNAYKEYQDTIHGKITDKVENTHSFTQMGRVIVEEGEKAQELTFDVGAVPPKLENDN